jgi:hypothetical protein
MKFQVFKDGKPATDFNVTAAYMFGADTIPLRDSIKIRCKNGVIDCRRKGMDTAGLVILWTVEGFGRLLLPTTRLPDRKEPYNLNLELARARLMQITLKREDWSLFEEKKSAAGSVDDAHNTFIEALKAVKDPAKCSLLADEALKKALICSEELATKHAEPDLVGRAKNKMLGRHTLGCQVDLKMMDDEKYTKHLFEMFGFVSIPMSWAQIEPVCGQYDFFAIDRCIEQLSQRRVAISAGPLLCFTPEHLPVWLMNKKWEFERIRDAAYKFISEVVGRYENKIHAWRIISGMHALNHFQFDYEQIIDMTRTACLAAKSSNSKSRKMIEVVQPWGEYYATNKNTIPPLVYLDSIVQSNISFDAFALQLGFGANKPGMHVRDMMQISSRLDCFVQLGKPLHITGVAVPGIGGSGDTDPELAGIWHEKWNPKIQSKWIESFYKIVLAKPFVNSVSYSQLADSTDTLLPAEGLLTAKVNPKKAYVSIAKLQKFILKR